MFGHQALNGPELNYEQGNSLMESSVTFEADYFDVNQSFNFIASNQVNISENIF